MPRSTPALGRTPHRGKHHWVPFFQAHGTCFGLGSSVLTGTGGPTLMVVVTRPFLYLRQNNMLAHVLGEGAGWSHAESFFWFVRKDPDITTFVYLSGPSSLTWPLSHLLSLPQMYPFTLPSHTSIYSFTPHSFTHSLHHLPT